MLLVRLLPLLPPSDPRGSCLRAVPRDTALHALSHRRTGGAVGRSRGDRRGTTSKRSTPCSSPTRGSPPPPKLNDQKQPVDKTFVVTIAADIEPGLYEVFAKGLWGVSNPRRFAISARPPDQRSGAEQRLRQTAGPHPESGRQRPDGRQGSDVDWYAFTAQAGQRIVFDRVAAQIDSRMTPVLEVYDASGSRCPRSPAAPPARMSSLVFDVPVDGPYLLRLHDVTLSQRERVAFYRLDAHTGPHLVFAWPPGRPGGQTLKVAPFGYNLPPPPPAPGRVAASGQMLPQPERVEVDILPLAIPPPSR